MHLLRPSLLLPFAKMRLPFLLSFAVLGAYTILIMGPGIPAAQAENVEWFSSATLDGVSLDIKGLRKGKATERIELGCEAEHVIKVTGKAKDPKKDIQVTLWEYKPDGTRETPLYAAGAIIPDPNTGLFTAEVRFKCKNGQVMNRHETVFTDEGSFADPAELAVIDGSQGIPYVNGGHTFWEIICDCATDYDRKGDPDVNERDPNDPGKPSQDRVDKANEAAGDEKDPVKKIYDVKKWVDDKLEVGGSRDHWPEPGMTDGQLIDWLKGLLILPQGKDAFMCIDHATLFASLVRALGFPARELDLGLSVPGYFQHAAVKVLINDRWYYFDPMSSFYADSDSKFMNKYKGKSILLTDPDRSVYETAIGNRDVGKTGDEEYEIKNEIPVQRIAEQGRKIYFPIEDWKKHHIRGATDPDLDKTDMETPIYKIDRAGTPTDSGNWEKEDEGKFAAAIFIEDTNENLAIAVVDEYNRSLGNKDGAIMQDISHGWYVIQNTPVSTDHSDPLASHPSNELVALTYGGLPNFPRLPSGTYRYQLIVRNTGPVSENFDIGITSSSIDEANVDPSLDSISGSLSPGEERAYDFSVWVVSTLPPTGANTYWLTVVGLLTIAAGLMIIKNPRFLKR